MDTVVFRWLNHWAGRSTLTDSIIVFFAATLPYILLILLGTFAVAQRRWRMLVAALASAGVARGIEMLIALAYHRPRPFLVLDTAYHLVGDGANGMSFPSSHATFFFALAVATYRFHRPMGTILLAGAAILGIARIIGGAHWPTDILGGALLGVLVASLVTRLIPALRPSTMEAHG